MEVTLREAQTSAPLGAAPVPVPGTWTPHHHHGSSLPPAGNFLSGEGRGPANTFTVGWALPVLALLGAKPSAASKEKAPLCAVLCVLPAASICPVHPPLSCPPQCLHLSCPPQRLHPSYPAQCLRPSRKVLGAAHPSSSVPFFTQLFSNHLRISQETKPKLNQKSSAKFKLYETRSEGAVAAVCIVLCLAKCLQEWSLPGNKQCSSNPKLARKANTKEKL